MNKSRSNARKRKRKEKALLINQEIFASEGLQVDFEAHAEGGEPKAFEATAYSGGKLYVGGFDQPVVVDLKGLEVNANANLLLDHKSDQRLGHPDRISVEADSIKLVGRLSAASPYRDEVMASHIDGFRWHLSIGARIINARRIEAGQSVFVNGRNQTGPFILATSSRLNEISFVGNGGDENTEVRIAAEHAARETEMNDNENVEVLETETVEASTDVVEQVKDQGKETKPVDIAAQMRQSASSTATHIAKVSKIFTGYPELVASAIEGEWSDDKCELELMKANNTKLEAMRESRPSGPAIHSHSHEDLLDTDVMAAGLHRRSGLRGISDNDSVLTACYGEKAMEVSDKLPKYAGLNWLAVQVIKAAGGHVEAGTRYTPETHKLAVRADKALRAAGGSDLNAASSFSTFSLTNVLSNVQNKSLMAVYNMWPTLVPRLCSTAQHNDFKERITFRIDEDMKLERLAPTGEIQHGTIDPEEFKNIVYAYARMFSVDMQTFIDDDLNAFAQVGQLQGNAAMRTREIQFWTTVLNPASVGVGQFFDSTALDNKTNHISGAGALSNANLGAAKLLMRQMKSTNGHPIMVQPEAIVTSTQLEDQLEQLLSKNTIQVVNDNNAAGTPNNEFRVFDQYRGRFEPITTPYMDTGVAIPGANGTSWFLWGDRMSGGAYEYAHLTGQETPEVDTDSTDFNVWGAFQTRAIWSFGFAERLREAVVRVDA